MDQAIVPYVLAGIVTLLAGLFWRQLANSDREQNKRNDSIDAAFAEHRQREETMRDKHDDLLAKYNELRVEMANKVGYTDLKDLKDTMHNLSNTVIAALGHKGGSVG